MTRRPRQLRSTLSPRVSRRGSVYVLVLGVSTLVTIVGLGTIALARSQARASVSTRDAIEAATLAQSGLEYAIAWTRSSTDWRSTARNRAPISPIRLGNGIITLTIIDEADGNLANNTSQPVRIYSQAIVGRSTRMVSMLAQPAAASAIPAMSTALHALGNVTVTDSATATSGAISSNGSISNSAFLTANVEAQTVSSTGFISGRVTTGAAAKSLPDPAIIDEFVALATTIPLSGVPGRNINERILTPTLNTISGTTNSRGIYLISVPNGQNLTIQNSRIEGLLIISLEQNASLTVTGSMLWQRPANDMPALLVVGQTGSFVTLNISSAPLSEDTARLNFNPVGAPYQGTDDSDRTDTYPSGITGLVHIADARTNLIITGEALLSGPILAAGTVTINGKAQLSGNRISAENPPLGYGNPTASMTVVPGSFRWEVSTAGLP